MNQDSDISRKTPRPHVRGLVVVAGVAAALALGACGGTNESDEQDATSLAANPTGVVRLVVRSDGSTAAVHWDHDDSPDIAIWDGGKLISYRSENVPDDAALAEGPAGSIVAAFVRTVWNGNNKPWEIVVARSTAAGFQLQTVHASATKLGRPAIATDGAGNLYVAFGATQATLLTTCPSAGACTTQTIGGNSWWGYDNAVAVAATPGDVVVAVEGGNVIRNQGGQWISTSLAYNGVPLVSSTPQRAVVALTDGYATKLFASTGGAPWTPLATLPVPRVQGLRLDAGGAAHVFVRRRLGHTELWKAYAESDAFLDRGANVRDASKYVAVGHGPEGDFRALKSFPHYGYGATISVEHPIAKPGYWSQPGLGGAGQLTYGPCMAATTDLSAKPMNPQTVKNLKKGYIEHLGGIVVTDVLSVPNGTLIVDPNTCIVAQSIEVSGKLVVAGTPQQPVHIYGSVLASSNATSVDWAFLEHTQVVGGGKLSHVSVAGEVWSPRITAAVGVSQTFDGSYTSSPWLAALTVSDSRVGPIHAAADLGFPGDGLSIQGPAVASVTNSRFVDIAGSAVRIDNPGMNHMAVSISDVIIQGAGSGVRATGNALNRAQLAATYSTYTNPELKDPLSAQVDLTHVEITGLGQPQNGVTVSFAAPQPGVDLLATTGTLTDVGVSGSLDDGIRLVDPGAITIDGCHVVDSEAHGIEVIAAPPIALGPCVPQPNGSPVDNASAKQKLLADLKRDPIVQHTVVSGSGGAGIEVSGPHVPMQVSFTKLVDNRKEAFAIRSGRGISKGGWDANFGCVHGEAEVDLPLSPLTTIHDNDLLGNGVDSAGISFFSDHRSGTLPAATNYWGTVDVEAVESMVQCTGACSLLPLGTAPM